MKDDIPTLAAFGVLAMMVTTIDHEVIGHGSACLLGGGAVIHISTTLFACTQPSPWVAAGGPAFDLLVGLAAWITGTLIAPRRTGWRLFLLMVGALSLFWESGYLVKAMLSGDGDLYFFARGMLGQPEAPWKAGAELIGVILFLVTMRMTDARLMFVLQDAGRARRAARLLWFAASLAAVLAALAFKGDFWPNLRDAALEIGLAACPLLLIPRRDGTTVPAPPLARNGPVILFAACFFIAFTATIGHGLGSFS